MPEPTTTTVAAAATVAGAAVSTSALSAFGVQLGLHADVLIAGFFGSLVAMILLNTVPAAADTWQDLVSASMRRLAVAWASSITAGYLTPLTLLVFNVPQPLLLSIAFLLGAGAQKVLAAWVSKYMPKHDKGEG